jgi:ribose-phosphate pyrophosphokinase
MMLKIFALSNDQPFARKVAEKLNYKFGKGYDNIIRLAEHEEYSFSDGECYIAPKPGIKENVRGCDVFVISSMYTDQNESVNDKIMKTLILCGALRDASARRITLVAPYYPYARQDRKTNSRAPITTKYMARLFSEMWVDRLLTLDVHNPTAIQNAYQVPVDLLEANRLFADHILKSGIDPHLLTILSPDSGGLGRARKFRKILSDKFKSEVGIACLDKVHQGFNITGYDIMGTVKGRNIIIYDDMISSGKTVSECIRACFPVKDENGWANSVLGVCATHGLFVGSATENLWDDRLKKIIIADTIQPFRLDGHVLRKVEIINTTELFSEAIARIHNNDSISDLLSNGQHH